MMRGTAHGTRFAFFQVTPQFFHIVGLSHIEILLVYFVYLPVFCGFYLKIAQLCLACVQSHGDT